jgi:tRNA-dihydrouridine synthase
MMTTMSRAGLRPHLGLAPMEGVTDFATRLWFQWIGGMDFTWTPFLRVTDTFPLKYPEFFAPEIHQLKGLLPVPLIFQVMGSRPEDVVRTHDLLGDRVTFLDLNCGCPSPTVVGSRAGSSLLERADIFGAFIEFITKRIGARRLSVKMRTGFHSATEFPTLLAAIAEQPLKHLTIHGRTRPDRYRGKADWQPAISASDKVPYPIIGSGDLCDQAQIIKMRIHAPKVSSVIIGRGALRNPWVFVDAVAAPIVPALAAFVVLQDAQLESEQDLIGWVAMSKNIKFGSMDADDFMRQAIGLMSARGQSVRNLHDIVVSSRALSRGKMLWNYLRTSLPSPYMDPMLMRSTSLRDLITGIEVIARQQGHDTTRLPVQYQSQFDWMFSGEGRVNKCG